MDETWEETGNGAAERRPRVQSVARAASILTEVAQSAAGLSVKEISERVGITYQAAYHLIHTLTEMGLLTRDERNRYLLGLRVGTLSEGFRRHLAPPEHLAVHVRGIAEETGETAYAAGWRDEEIVVLNMVRGANPVTANTVLEGFTADGHARASGKLLLAFADPVRRARYLSAHPPRPLTPRTLFTMTDLEQEFGKIRGQGYATDHEELTPGLCCLAVPLDGGGSPFALGLSAPRERFEENFSSYLSVMRRRAQLASGAPTSVLSTHDGVRT